MCGNNCDIYYSMYECFALTSFPPLSQHANSVAISDVVCLGGERSGRSGRGEKPVFLFLFSVCWIRPEEVHPTRVSRRMLEREKALQEYFFGENVFFISANILGCKCEDI